MSSVLSYLYFTEVSSLSSTALISSGHGENNLTFGLRERKREREAETIFTSIFSSSLRNKNVYIWAAYIFYYFCSTHSY